MAREKTGLHKKVPCIFEFVQCILMYICHGRIKFSAVELKVNSTNLVIVVPGKLS